MDRPRMQDYDNNCDCSCCCNWSEKLATALSDMESWIIDRLEKVEPFVMVISGHGVTLDALVSRAELYKIIEEIREKQ